ncbi:hypothetical protein FE257_010558 [Aspergillus nanangensis]|uniref:Homeobox and C2H2 transcription factor n=1 Tax=Aspergillus nanangensis TaxID=2582783 RepID=A0AAD4CI94_ASPNN|nr:hypothetical protein FE257_010558 [Aspergillus nanangensis]
MEYFDFDEASYGSFARDGDAASDQREFDDHDDAVAHNEFLSLEQPLEFSMELPEGVPDPVVDNGVYPMFRAKDPCDFCRHMGLDCFIAKRGVMQNSGCTCCISLYRVCSFTHAKAPGKFLDTLHPINENVDIPTGGLTGKKALKSLSGIGATDDGDGRTRTSSSRLSREAVRILKNWLQEHHEHPYPNPAEKEELKLRTGLKSAQISNWLANTRRRGKVRPPLRSSSPPIPGAIDVPRQSFTDPALMTPLERWKHSPPENEPAATSDILRALVNTSLDSSRPRSSQVGHVRSHSRKTGSSGDSSHANSNIIPTPSISSYETSRSASHSSISDLSFASAFSHRSSLGSFGSMERKERRRRRKTSTAINPFNQQKARGSRVFQCTFCADTFQTKYDWQRHEKSLHLALEKWTCSPNGGVVVIDSLKRCVFCMAVNPDNDHMEAHNYSTCNEKTTAERTFYRKDHLNQHLRLMHNVRFHPSMDKWRSNTCEIRSRCGFCGTVLTTWKDRVDHLASHFKSGADMAQWQGDWGFEPYVQSLVENAMPPYLIGHEHTTLDPYKSSEAIENPQDLINPGDVNCFYRLRNQLTDYIRTQMIAGTIPTDQMIQTEARMVVYDNDDPWNQTCADNPVWLSLLKRDAGLETVPDSEHIQLENLGMQPPFAAQNGLRRPPLETNMSAKSVCRRQPFGSGYSTPSIPSSPFPGTGRSSAIASVPESSVGSYADSAGMAAPVRSSGLSTDWGSSLSAGVSSFSTPGGSVDPFVQMGFDPEFLQRLNENYEDLDLDDLQGLGLEEPANHDKRGLEQAGEPNLMEGVLPGPNAGTAPIPIPSPKNTDVLMIEADLHRDPQHVGRSTSNFPGMGGI